MTAVMRWRVFQIAVGVVALAFLVSGCAEGVAGVVFTGVKDAAGMTRGEVEALGPEGQFTLVGERYERMQELMTEAQLVVSDGEWKWKTPGFEANGGTTAYAPLAGASYDNAFYMSMVRAINPEGAVGAAEDARPVFDYFVSQGWDVSLTEDDFSELELEATRDVRVQAVTEDGYRVHYTVQQNGQYNMEVITDTFWGDANEIMREQDIRIPDGHMFPPGLPPELSTAPGQSVPGVYTAYPKWSDPIVRGREKDHV